MMQLHHAAETFLARLDDNLGLLSGDEREAVLLELRGHFLELQHQGPEHLHSALNDMGPAESLAGAFVDASVTAMRRTEPPPRGVMLPAVIANSNLPGMYRREVPRLNVREIVRDFRATLDATGDGLRGVCAFLVAGYTITAFLGSVHQLMPGQVSTPSWLLFAARIGIGIIGTAAAYRCILGKDDEVWQIDLPMIRYALASILLALVIFGPSHITLEIQQARITDMPGPYPFYHQPASLLLWIAISVLALRLQPWAVSLVLDRPISGRSSWSGTCGKTMDLAFAWVTTVAPPLLVHLVVSLAVLQLSPLLLTRFGVLICFVDALAVMAMTIAAAIINSMTFRWVVREPIPAPRPFSTTRPTDAQIAESNMRFQRVLVEKWRADREKALSDRPPHA